MGASKDMQEVVAEQAMIAHACCEQNWMTRNGAVSAADIDDGFDQPDWWWAADAVLRRRSARSFYACTQAPGSHWQKTTAAELSEPTEILT